MSLCSHCDPVSLIMIWIIRWLEGGHQILWSLISPLIPDHKIWLENRTGCHEFDKNMNSCHCHEGTREPCAPHVLQKAMFGTSHLPHTATWPISLGPGMVSPAGKPRQNHIYIYNKKIMRNQLTLNMDFFYQKIKIIIRISIFLTYLLHLSHTIVFTHLVYNSVLLKKVFLG